MKNNDVVCTNCGVSNNPGARFCKSCGQKLPVPEITKNPPTTTNKNQSKSNKMWIIGLLLFLIIGGAAIAGYFIFIQPSKTSETSPDTIAENDETDKETGDETDKETNEKIKSKINNRIISWFNDLAQEKAVAAEYFAPEVRQFISLKNTTPSVINENLIKYSFPEYKNYFATIKKGTLEVLDNGVDPYNVMFTEELSAYRVSKGSSWNVTINVEAGFDQDFNIIYWVEKKYVKKKAKNENSYNDNNVNSNFGKFEKLLDKKVTKDSRGLLKLISANEISRYKQSYPGYGVITIITYKPKVKVLKDCYNDFISGDGGGFRVSQYGDTFSQKLNAGKLVNYPEMEIAFYKDSNGNWKVIE
jgi:zinc ribbon protein